MQLEGTDPSSADMIPSLILPELRGLTPVTAVATAWNAKKTLSEDTLPIPPAPPPSAPAPVFALQLALTLLCHARPFAFHPSPPIPSCPGTSRALPRYFAHDMHRHRLQPAPDECLEHATGLVPRGDVHGGAGARERKVDADEL